MHKFLRAVGFSDVADKKELQRLIINSIQQSTDRDYATRDGLPYVAQFCKEYLNGAGLAVCGTFDEEQRFTYDYYYPYLRGTSISSAEQITVEQHAAEDSYAGMCDDVRVGVSLIFYLQNMIPYIKLRDGKGLPSHGTSLTLSALSVRGTILMPIAKTRKQRESARRKSVERARMIAAARDGDERAIESLTLEDMDLYTAVTNRVRTDDIFTIVDNYFMPYGMECDQYSVLGEIMEWRKETNFITHDTVYILKVDCNGLIMDIAINGKDLYGEPGIGRRFKGSIWMQGFINYLERQM